MKLARYILLIVLVVLLVFSLKWAKQQAADEVCTGVDICVLNQDIADFVKPEKLEQVLIEKKLFTKGKAMWQINTYKIEQALKESEFLEDANCMKGIDGKIKINVTQLIPCLRVIDGNQSYYINRQGKRMPANVDFTADLPIVVGHFSKDYGPEKLMPLVEYVNADSTLNALVTMYCFNDPNNIFIVPSIHGHVVNLGSINGFENKFKKLALFYKKVMPVRGWLTYDTLSLKWDHQVVASLRNMKAKPQMTGSIEDDEA
ncbi:MAG: hypothetical protein IK092_00900, partial [Muribaculaceae bacterium]|nr:hypothetical protein [Muribaculaceae bacterium]